MTWVLHVPEFLQTVGAPHCRVPAGGAASCLPSAAAPREGVLPKQDPHA